MQNPIAPDFLVTGTAKAGTTSLFAMLDTHPDICLAQPKETWFFDGAEYAKGVEHYMRAYFGHWEPGQICGEVATSPLFTPFCAERISQSSPQTKLIAILRDPVERAFSDWWMMHSRGWDPMSFDEAIDDNLRRLETGPDFSDPQDWADHLAAIRDTGLLRYRTYVDYGFYSEQLDRYHAHGLSDQMMVLQFEKMREIGPKYLEGIFDFLDLEPPKHDLETTFSKPQNEALPSFRIGQLARFMQNIGVSAMVPQSVKVTAKKWMGKHSTRPKISPDARAKLNALYKDRNARLTDCASLDLNLWPSMKNSD